MMALHATGGGMYCFAIIGGDSSQRARLGSMVRSSTVASELQELSILSEVPDESAPEGIAKGFSADIILLDMHEGLSHDTGISLVEKVIPKGSSTQVIYVSARVEHISDIYRTDRAWFLPKPVRQQDLDCVLERVVDRLNVALRSPLVLRSKGTLTKIIPQRILYIESNRRKVVIYERDRVTETYAKISDIERLLPPEFIRCHKSFLVNMNHIVELNSKNIVLAGGLSVPVSQRCHGEVRERFLRHVGRAL